MYPTATAKRGFATWWKTDRSCLANGSQNFGRFYEVSAISRLDSAKVAALNLTLALAQGEEISAHR